MTNPLHTELCDRLGSRYPIIQTAMGWVARPELVAGTCNAGGFGFLAAGVMRADEVGPAIRRVRDMTDKPFGVNFHMFQPGAEQIVETLINERVRAVSFGRGPNKDMVARFRKAGILCVPTVGAVRHAQKMVELGVDMVVVQGSEGGGHTGAVASNILLPQVLDAVKVPVVAAGGYSDGRGLAAAITVGAVGIAMGTRFLLTKDCPVPEVTKQQYLKANVDDIIVTTKIDGLPQRVVRNKRIDAMEKASTLGLIWQSIQSGLEFKKMSGASYFDLIKSAKAMAHGGETTVWQLLMSANAPALYQRAMLGGDPESGLMGSGQVAGTIRELPTCNELIQRIMSEARARFTALGVPLDAAV